MQIAEIAAGEVAADTAGGMAAVAHPLFPGQAAEFGQWTAQTVAAVASDAEVHHGPLLEEVVQEEGAAGPSSWAASCSVDAEEEAAEGGSCVT